MSGGRWDPQTRIAVVVVGMLVVAVGTLSTVQWRSGPGAAALVIGGLLVALAGVAGGTVFGPRESPEIKVTTGEPMAIDRGQAGAGGSDSQGRALAGGGGDPMVTAGPRRLAIEAAPARGGNGVAGRGRRVPARPGSAAGHTGGAEIGSAEMFDPATAMIQPEDEPPGVGHARDAGQSHEAGDTESAAEALAQQLRATAPYSVAYHDAVVAAVSAAFDGRPLRPAVGQVLGPLTVDGLPVAVDIRAGTGFALSRMRRTYRRLFDGPPPVTSIMVVVNTDDRHAVDAVVRLREELGRPLVVVAWQIGDPTDSIADGVARIRRDGAAALAGGAEPPRQAGHPAAQRRPGAPAQPGRPPQPARPPQPPRPSQPLPAQPSPSQHPGQAGHPGQPGQAGPAHQAVPAQQVPVRPAPAQPAPGQRAEPVELELRTTQSRAGQPGQRPAGRHAAAAPDQAPAATGVAKAQAAQPPPQATQPQTHTTQAHPQAAQATQAQAQAHPHSSQAQAQAQAAQAQAHAHPQAAQAQAAQAQAAQAQAAQAQTAQGQVAPTPTQGMPVPPGSVPPVPAQSQASAQAQAQDSTGRRAAAPGGDVPQPRRAGAPGRQLRYDDTAAWRYASDLHWRGQLQEAEDAYRSIVDARGRALGWDHVDTLTARDQHATVLRDLERLAEALVECDEVLGTRSQLLGDRHPDTLTSRSHLATIYHQTGDLTRAEVEHRRVLEARAEVLGPRHAETLISRSNLAKVYQDLGELDQAIAEHRTVLRDRAEVLGDVHRDTLMSRSLLASALHLAGRLDEAEQEHREVLRGRLREMGPTHLDTAVSRHRLASVLHDLDRLDEAVAEYRTAREVYAQLLGASSPFARAAASDLALAERALRHRPR